MGSHTIRWFEGGILIFFSIFVVMLSIYNPQYEMSNVPIAVGGLTTTSGILVAFVGFSLTHAYSSHDNYQFRRWFKRRVTIIVFPIVIGLMFIAFAYLCLVQNQLAISFKFAMTGFFMILAVLLESYLIMIADESDYLMYVS